MSGLRRPVVPHRDPGRVHLGEARVANEADPGQGARLHHGVLQDEVRVVELAGVPAHPEVPAVRRRRVARRRPRHLAAPALHLPDVVELRLAVLQDLAEGDLPAVAVKRARDGAVLATLHVFVAVLPEADGAAEVGASSHVHCFEVLLDLVVGHLSCAALAEGAGHEAMLAPPLVLGELPRVALDAAALVPAPLQRSDGREDLFEGEVAALPSTPRAAAAHGAARHPPGAALAGEVAVLALEDLPRG